MRFVLFRHIVSHSFILVPAVGCLAALTVRVLLLDFTVQADTQIHHNHVFNSRVCVWRHFQLKGAPNTLSGHRIKEDVMIPLVRHRRMLIVLNLFPLQTLTTVLKISLSSWIPLPLDRTLSSSVRFQVLTAASMKLRILWDVLLFS
jgi:hypothetical protein